MTTEKLTFAQKVHEKYQQLSTVKAELSKKTLKLNEGICIEFEDGKELWINDYGAAREILEATKKALKNRVEQLGKQFDQL